MGGEDSFPEGETCGLHPSLSFIAPQIINVSVHDTGMAWGHIIRPLDTDLTSISNVIYYSKTQVIMS